MKKVWLGIVALTGLMLNVGAASSQAPGRDGDRGRGDRRGGPPRFEVGHVLPPPLVEELQLTKEQQAEIAKLEQEVKQRLAKILTAEQIKKVEAFRPRGPGGPPGGGRDRPRPGRDTNPPGRPERPDRPESEQAKQTAAGIQWFATWESGLREAQRTGRPILLVSAAPHCAGVPGIW
jgi:hypothetical protein